MSSRPRRPYQKIHLLRLLRPGSHRAGASVDQARANAETTNQVLDALRASYPDRRLLLVGDNVRYHHAKAVRSYAAQLEIQLLYLPPYSPDLMPVERLWQ